MGQRQQVLVVAQQTRLGNALVSWLSDAGYDIAMVTTFQAAKFHLQSRPDLIITELKLADYNGLHLALKAQNAGIPAIVLGPSDVVLQRDAEELGASYLSSVPSRDALIALVEHRIAPRNAEGASSDSGEVTGSAEAQMLWRAFNPIQQSTSSRRFITH